MVEALVGALAANGDDVLVLAYDRGHEELMAPFGKASTLDLSGFFRGALSPMKAIRLLAALRRARSFFFIGADVLDGAYTPNMTVQRFQVVNLAARLGLRTSVVSCSYRQVAAPYAQELAQALEPAVRLVARDPRSRERATRAFDRPVALGADLAFLLEPAGDHEPEVRAAQGWIDAARAHGNRVIAFAPNYLISDLPLGLETESRDLVAVYRAVVERLLRVERLAVVLVPHDRRGEVSDFTLVAAMADGLDRSRVLPLSPTGPRVVKAVLRLLDTTLTTRMHVGIGSLGSGTPCRIMDYQGKVEGLGLHIGIPALGFAPSVLLNPEQFAECAEAALGAADDERKRLHERLPALRELARVNLTS